MGRNCDVEKKEMGERSIDIHHVLVVLESGRQICCGAVSALPGISLMRLCHD